MAWLNGEWFENDVPETGGPGDITVVNGFAREIHFARHCPPDGVYWLGESNVSRYAARALGCAERPVWTLVKVGRSGIGPLVTMRGVWSGQDDCVNLDFDFTDASWVGPVEMPPEPPEPPQRFARRL